MKKWLLSFLGISFFGCYQSNDYQECFEPLFYNETAVDVSLLYGNMENENALDSLYILQGDTAFSQPGMNFPFLYKEGLGAFASNLYDVRLVFHTMPQKCETFYGTEFQKYDIRDFSSYEYIGKCENCFVRGQSEPSAMLYRITEDMFNQANPCE